MAAIEIAAHDVEALLGLWQGVLRLRDWDIDIQLVDPPWRKSGDIKIDLDDRKAVLLINRRPASENLEELVVHELLHVKLYAMDQMIEDLLAAVYGMDADDPRREFAHSQFMLVLESTVQDLTKACLTAAGKTGTLSYGRLRAEVERETGRHDRPGEH